VGGSFIIKTPRAGVVSFIDDQLERLRKVTGGPRNDRF
jgi:hypothetical protein